MLVLHAYHTVPVLDDHGVRRVAGVNEIRKDLPVIGWANLMDVEIYGDCRQFLMFIGEDDDDGD